MVINGWELINSYSELVNPIDQAERFIEQEQANAEGDEEAMTGDAEFVRAMEYGMPPCAGIGLSERLFAILSDKSIRETVVFPLMKDAKAAPTHE